MIARILTFLLWAILVAAVIFWLLNGGWAKAKLAAASLGNPVSSILQGTPWGGSFRLPGSPTIPQGIDISQYTGDAGADTAIQYDELSTQMAQARSLGAPSPYAGQINISVGDAGTASEYVEVRADGTVQPLSLTGWSLQSALSGMRMPLPAAADLFVMGGGSALTPVILPPGGSLIVSSGISPVSISFHENSCTGYLAQLQQYAPSLSSDCPSPASSALPRTNANESRFGASCFDYLENLPLCTFPTSMPSSLSPACRAMLADRLSYNGCVRAFQARPDFSRDRWRLFLGAQGPLWRTDRDTIRLLDPQGQTVATYSY